MNNFKSFIKGFGGRLVLLLALALVLELISDGEFSVAGMIVTFLMFVGIDIAIEFFYWLDMRRLRWGE